MSKVYATQDFNDAGTGQAFLADKEVDASAGQIANYKAAGLVSDEAPKAQAKPADPKPTEPAKPAT